ncbi:Calx-beta domain-containing protein [Paracoccus rhizosphaerae]|uniref:Calx-beta domain-containing protein n=1 Tax=Paracoccus rhizosphaerae TaxID=1133347 RepID=A0ABV6CEV9_9RHOB
MAVSNPVVKEGAGGTATFVVSLSQPFSEDRSFTYSTTSGTALAGSDFASRSGSVTFLAGQTEATGHCRFWQEEDPGRSGPFRPTPADRQRNLAVVPVRSEGRHGWHRPKGRSRKAQASSARRWPRRTGQDATAAPASDGTVFRSGGVLPRPADRQ